MRRCWTTTREVLLLLLAVALVAAAAHDPDEATAAGAGDTGAFPFGPGWTARTGTTPSRQADGGDGPNGLEAALACARRGLSVFPCHTIRGDFCTCGKKKDDFGADPKTGQKHTPGKHPATIHGASEATTDAARIRALFGRDPELNYGIVAGKSNLVMLDADVKGGGLESLKRLAALVPELKDETVEVVSGNVGPNGERGGHKYYRGPADVEIKGRSGAFGKEYPGLDVIAGNKYVIGPGSLHSSGRRYEWVPGRSIFEREPIPFPDGLVRLMGGASAADTPREPYHPPIRVSPGSRYDAVVSMAASLTARGWAKKAVGEAVYRQAAETFESKPDEPPVTAEKIRLQITKEAEHVWEAYHDKAPPFPKALGANGAAPDTGGATASGEDAHGLVDGLEANDVGDAARLASIHSENIKWIPTEERWLARRPDNTWERVDDPYVLRFVGDVAPLIRRMIPEAVLAVEARSFKNADEKGAKIRETVGLYLGHARKLGNVNHQANVLRAAKGMNQFRVRVEQLDANPDLVAFTNGVFDFANRTFRTTRPEDLVTRRLNDPYTPDAAAPDFQGQIGQTFDQDQDRINVYQQWMGYCLTGRTDEKRMMIRIGGRNTAKSTLQLIELRVMGGLAKDIQPECFVRDPSSRLEVNPVDLAHGAGMRLFYVTETKEGARFHVDRLKRWIGGGAWTGRIPYAKEAVRFFPQAKVDASSNDRIEFDQERDAMDGKVLVLAFEHYFTQGHGENAQSKIVERCTTEAERAGILAWIVKGELARREKSLIGEPPPSVQKAIDEYAKEMSPNERWAEACLKFDLKGPQGGSSDFRGKGGDLLASRSRFGIENDYPRTTSRKIGDWLRKVHGLASPTDGAHTWIGVRLRDDAQARLGGQTKWAECEEAACKLCHDIHPVDANGLCEACCGETLGGTGARRQVKANTEKVPLVRGSVTFSPLASRVYEDLREKGTKGTNEASGAPSKIFAEKGTKGTPTPAVCAVCGEASAGRKDFFGRDVCDKCLSLTPPTGERVGTDAGAVATPPEPGAAAPSVGPGEVVQPVARELVLRAVRGLGETEAGATSDRVRQQAAAYGAGGEAVEGELRYLLEMGRLRLDPDGRLREAGA